MKTELKNKYMIALTLVMLLLTVIVSGCSSDVGITELNRTGGQLRNRTSDPGSWDGRCPEGGTCRDIGNNIVEFIPDVNRSFEFDCRTKCVRLGIADRCVDWRRDADWSAWYNLTDNGTKSVCWCQGTVCTSTSP